ncbi:hypothetical protein ACFL3Q_03905 [Planctomycetota bacterium]
MANTDALIITHGDVDGMVCAAQLIRREKSQCELRFSNAKYIKSALARILRSSRKPRRIYISDIPPNAEVVKIISTLKEHGTKVFWIDHHPWEDDIREQIENCCDKVIYNESMQTPAGVLMGKWLQEEDPYYGQVGNICYAYEKGTEWERDWFLLLTSYIGNSGSDVLERLAYDHDFNTEDLQRIEQKKKDELKAAEVLIRTPCTMETRSGKTMAVYDTSKDPGIYLGHKVFDHQDVDYCLIHIMEKKWQLACNPSRKQSMKHLMGEKNIDGRTFSLAGRENELLAIESKLNENIKSEAHEMLIDWLCKKL